MATKNQNLSTYDPSTVPSGKGMRFGIVVSEWNNSITDALLDGALSTLKSNGVQEEDITIVNIYACNTGAPQYIRQTLTDIKGEINSDTIIVGDFNTPLTPMDRSSKQKISKHKS